jgi:hypothetical protein
MVFITVRVKGPHDRLCAAYDRIADFEESNVPELRCHTCAKTADGILVSGTWESREAFDRLMASAAFQKILEEANLPPPEIEVLAVHRSRH